MKKSLKPFIAMILLIFIALTFLILSYVRIKLECEMLIKDKVLAEEKFNSKKNWRVNLVAQHQFLSTKERIAEIAKNELGMVEKTDYDTILIVSKDKINRIAEILDREHD
jgi:cell division protein FtsL